jgi:hypothetical protein
MRKRVIRVPEIAPASEKDWLDLNKSASVFADAGSTRSLATCDQFSEKIRLRNP